MPGWGGRWYNPHTTEVLGCSPGSLAVPGGTEKVLEEQGKFGLGSPFPGERVFSIEGRSRTKAGRKDRVFVCEEAGRFREAEQAWCGWRLWADVGNR